MTEKESLPSEQREVELVPHDPEWSQQADQEIFCLRAGLSFPIIGIYHIGSTSIPGIKAKPILDFVMEVESLDDVIKAIAEVEALGYENKGEFGIPGRQFFTRDTDGNRSHHLHVFQKGHPDIERHTIFRDFLRANPEAAREYEQLKEILAKRFPKQSSNYTAAKSDFILSMDEVARYWLEQNQFKSKENDSQD
jgi:GrpB-like predicted nucleotidyltransferase (UPF0157 family)